jgi:hypothetical protein
MGFLTNIVDSFFKNLQNGLSNQYQSEANRQWEKDHPALTEEEFLQNKNLKEEEERKKTEINDIKNKRIAEYNLKVQKEKLNYLKSIKRK